MLLYITGSVHLEIAVVFEFIAGVPVDESIHVLSQHLLEHRQLTRVLQQFLHAQDGHLVVLVRICLATLQQFGVNFKGYPQVQLEGDLLQDS